MRHCAANIIEHGGGVGPIAADCLQRLGRRETTLSADEAILDSALAVGAMADFTIVSIDLLAVRDGTAALRQTRAVRPDINVPQLDLVWRGALNGDCTATLRADSGATARDSHSHRFVSSRSQYPPSFATDRYP